MCARFNISCANPFPFHGLACCWFISLITIETCCGSVFCRVMIVCPRYHLFASSAVAIWDWGRFLFPARLLLLTKRQPLSGNNYALQVQQLNLSQTHYNVKRIRHFFYGIVWSMVLLAALELLCSYVIYSSMHFHGLSFSSYYQMH